MYNIYDMIIHYLQKSSVFFFLFFLYRAIPQSAFGWGLKANTCSLPKEDSLVVKNIMELLFILVVVTFSKKGRYLTCHQLGIKK